MVIARTFVDLFWFVVFVGLVDIDGESDGACYLFAARTILVSACR